MSEITTDQVAYCYELADERRQSWQQREARVLARLAWNNWPDNENSRREIAAHEVRDPISAEAWDRVVCAITKSAPPLDTPQNNAEKLPQREPAEGGAGTIQQTPGA